MLVVRGVCAVVNHVQRVAFRELDLLQDDFLEACLDGIVNDVADIILTRLGERVNPGFAAFVGGIVHPQYIRVHIIGGGAVVRQRVDVVVEGIDGSDRHQSRIQNLLGSLLQVDGMLGSHAGIHRLIVVDGIVYGAVLRF